MVLLHGRAREPANVFQATRRAVGAGLAGGAVELLQLEVDLEDVPEDQALERGVVRADLAGMVTHLLGEWITGTPGHHLAVVEGVGHTQHLGAGVLRVVVDAAPLEVAPAARLEIKPEHFRSP